MGTVYYAKWIVFPGGCIEYNGAVRVEGDTIAGAGSRSRIGRTPHDRVVNLGDVVLLPGFVNAHTHLEDGIVRGHDRQPNESFASWYAKKARRLFNASRQSLSQNIMLGIREALSNGITTIVDSSQSGVSQEVFRDVPIRSWVIREIHGESPSAEAIENDTDYPAGHSLHGAASYPGLGPAAIFSCPPAVQKNILEKTREHHWLWATHLAESAEELQAFSEHTGDLFFSIIRNQPWPFGTTGAGPVHYAITENLLPNNGLCFHGNYISGHELSLLAAKQISVVFCYRSSREMGHKHFPLDAALRRGINVCVGTGSTAIVHSLTLFEELYQIKQAYPHIPAGQLLDWVTVNPARALGAGHRLGRLQKGYVADMIAVSFAHSHRGDLLDELLTEEPEIRLVMVGGEEVVVKY